MPKVYRWLNPVSKASGTWSHAEYMVMHQSGRLKGYEVHEEIIPSAGSFVPPFKLVEAVKGREEKEKTN